jgi:hypothetical protein
MLFKLFASFRESGTRGHGQEQTPLVLRTEPTSKATLTLLFLAERLHASRFWVMTKHYRASSESEHFALFNDFQCFRARQI